MEIWRLENWRPQKTEVQEGEDIQNYRKVKKFREDRKIGRKNVF